MLECAQGWCKLQVKWQVELSMQSENCNNNHELHCSITNKGLECSGTDGGLNDVGHLETGL